MPDWHDFEIKNPGPSGHMTTIKMDGQELKGVVAVSTETDMVRTTVTVTFYAKSLNKDGVVQPVAGWKPEYTHTPDCIYVARVGYIAPFNNHPGYSCDGKPAIQY